MKSAFVALAALIAATASAVVLPVSPVKREDDDDKIFRSENGEGNTLITIGDGTLKIGHRVPSSLFDEVDKYCGETSCKPGTTYAKSLLITGNAGNEIELEIDISDSQFQPEGEFGSKKDLIDAGRRILAKLEEEGTSKREQGVPWIKNPCPATAVGRGTCMGQERSWADQWTTTDHINIQIRNKDEDGYLGFLNIGLKYKDSAAVTGYCSGAVGAAAAVAGIFSAPIAGAGITVASIACNTIS